MTVVDLSYLHILSLASISSENNELPTKDGQSKANTDPKHIALHPSTSSMSISTSPTSFEISHLDDTTGDKGVLTFILHMICKNIKQFFSSVPLLIEPYKLPLKNSYF